MFRMLRLVMFVGFGFYLGFKFKEQQMHTACTGGAGVWTGSVCLGSELIE